MKKLMLNADKKTIITHQERLKYTGLTDITSCFDQEMLVALKKETLSVFGANSKRRDFVSKHTDTPRNMFTVSEVDITRVSQVIKDFYYSTELMNFLSELAMEKVNCLPWEGERYVINGLIHNKDTHGWHWDDYAYALVYIAECPPKGAGGEVECVANTDWIKSNPNIQQIVTTRPVQSHYFEPGSVYFMRSDTTLHRVTGIDKPYQRLSVAMSYCNQADLSKDIDHLTVYDLYG
jgi:L-lysine 4-chlorinase